MGHLTRARAIGFDATKVLIDPYARAIVGDETYDRESAITPGDNCATAPEERGRRYPQLRLGRRPPPADFLTPKV